jgi:hypothetical protein
MTSQQALGGFSCDSVSPSGNNPYYDIKAPTGATTLFQPIVPEALVASSTTPFYNLVTGSLQQGSDITTAPLPGPLSDPDPLVGWTNSKAMGVSVSGAANIPVPGAVGYGVSALQYAKDSSYFALSSGGSQGTPPSAPDAPIVFPGDVRAGATTLHASTFYFDSSNVTGENPITFSFLYDTVNPPRSTAVSVSSFQPNTTSLIFAGVATNLTPGTTYYVQTVATNVYGFSKSATATEFLASSATVAPSGTIGTAEAIEVTQTSITVQVDASAVVPAFVYPFDGTSPVVVLAYQEGGITGNYLFTSVPLHAPANGLWVFKVDGLTANTTYGFVPYATNGVSPTVRSDQVLIQTASNGPPTAPPAPDAFPGASVTSYVVYFNSAGITGAEPITYSFKYGLTNPPTFTATATRANPAFTIYQTTLTGLAPNAPYFAQAVSTNQYGSTLSPVTQFQTPVPTGPPTGTIQPPAFVSATQTSISVTVNATAVVPLPSVYPPVSPNPTVILSYQPASGGSFTDLSVPSSVDPTGIWSFKVPGLTAGTQYNFKARASNGNPPDIVSTVSGPFSTANPAPVANLQNYVVSPFLIQGPRFNTPYSTALDYYLNVDAVGCVLNDGDSAISGQQVYGSMIAKSYGSPDFTGLCTSDSPYSSNYGAETTAYFTSLVKNDVFKLISWGGFNADILGLFGPYQPTGYPGTNPAVGDVTNSIKSVFLGVSGASNPLNWAKSGNSMAPSGWGTVPDFDGVVLDFENVGRGGLPGASNTYPPAQDPIPTFPADATDAKYQPYIQALADAASGLNVSGKILANAPVSLSINGDILTGKNNGNVGAANTALNTWYAFTDSTIVPSSTTYNSADSLALNHPNQMKYFDEVFVQFYNEAPDYYLGGSKFTNLLAQWGYVALLAQEKTVKKTRINIGLAKGNIIPALIGGVAIINAQGPTAPLDNETSAPYDYWYPQYCTPTPPNSIKSQNNPQYWPNTSPAKDPINLAAAINGATTILKAATGNNNLTNSDWCSGVGFWASENATLMAKAVYDKNNGYSPGTSLPKITTFLWADASYPTPDPVWPANTPIVPNY